MPGARQDDPRELALCERFLDLARKGNRGPEYAAALEGIYPLLMRTVEKVFRTWRTLPPGLVEAGDVAHDVLLRLQKSPPNREPGYSARVTVLKWIRVVTERYLTDLGRKASFISIKLDPEQLQEIMDARCDTRTSDPCGSEGLERRMDESRILSELERYLLAHYPRGAQYLEAIRSHPGATPEEAARILGTTRQNVYQIRKRLMDWVVKWREGISS